MLTRIATGLGMTLLLAGPVLADPASVEAVKALEQRQARVAVSGDKAELERLFAPDFALVNPSGALTSRQELLALLTGGTPYRSATFANERVLDYGETIVTVGLETVVPNTGPQAGKDVRRRITHVWHREGGRWLLELRHA
ncbi:nuclear transport factor 2 family protein, partial [bacterium]